MTGPEKEALEVLTPYLGDVLAKAIIEFRRHTKKSPITGYAAKLLLKQYQRTGNIIAAAEMQIERGWEGFKAEWYFNDLSKNNQRHPHQPRGDMADFTREYLEKQNEQRAMGRGCNQPTQFTLDYAPVARKH